MLSNKKRNKEKRVFKKKKVSSVCEACCTQKHAITASYQSKKFHRHANILAARFPHRTIPFERSSHSSADSSESVTIVALARRRNRYIFARTTEFAFDSRIWEARTGFTPCFPIGTEAARAFQRVNLDFGLRQSDVML